jgi:hypothetical protein
MESFQREDKLNKVQRGARTVVSKKDIGPCITRSMASYQAVKQVRSNESGKAYVMESPGGSVYNKSDDCAGQKAREGEPNTEQRIYSHLQNKMKR